MVYLSRLAAPRAPPPRMEFWSQAPSWERQDQDGPDLGSNIDFNMLLAKMQVPMDVDSRFWSEVLMENGALYCSLSDSDLGTASEVPIFAEHVPGAPLESWDELLEAKHLWANVTLEAGFAPGTDVESVLLGAAAAAGLPSAPRFELENVGDRDWVTEVQSNWPPIVLPGCLLIRFPWHPPADDLLQATKMVAFAAGGDGSDVPATSLTLHPGMAFGTGEHQTTQLCCEALKAALADDAARGCTVLDYGSGSGVLSFAALRFGAARAVGVEIDPQALAASVRNAEENGLGDRFDAMLPDAEAAAAGDERYPLVVANILAGTLVELAPLIAARVAAGGTLLLSGIWGEEQATRVTEAYAAQGFGSCESRATNEWTLLTLRA